MLTKNPAVLPIRTPHTLRSSASTKAIGDPIKSIASRATRTSIVCCAVFAALLAIATTAKAQCVPQWQTVNSTATSEPGTNGTVYATTTWDPDGPGPQTPKLVVGGAFTLAGNIAANYIATFDPATGQWAPLGTGMNNEVRALITLPGGDLVAGGLFFRAGGVAADKIARWNAATAQWAPFSTGMNGPVLALTTLPSGDLVAGGTFNFDTGGGVFANYIARWNAATGQWARLGTGMNGTVGALTTLPNGDLVAGGFFTTAGGIAANNIARWNAATGQWAPVGTGTSGAVRALTTLPSGDLVAGGDFGTAGGVGASRIARWNVPSGLWAPLGTGTSGTVNALTTLPSGDLIVGGAFSTTGVAANRISRWNVATGQWTRLGTGADGPVLALTTLPSGDLIAGGTFTLAGGVYVSKIARWGCVPAACDDIDFNNNSVFPEDADVIDFFNVLAGAECPTCNDIDFNNNQVFPEDADVIDFFNVLAGGTCP